MRFIPAALPLLFALAACASQDRASTEPTDSAATDRVTTPTAPLGPDMGGTTTTLAVGDTFSVALPSNATTGYSWTATVPEILEQEGEGAYTTPPTPPGQEQMVGAGGTMRWHFRAVRPGQGSLDFAYSRSWERDTPPVQQQHYSIVVTE